MADEKKTAEKKAAKGNKKPGFFKRITKFFRETKSELKKVVYPTPKQLLNNTAVVLLCVLIVGICVWILDAVGGLAINGIMSLVG